MSLIGGRVDARTTGIGGGGLPRLELVPTPALLVDGSVLQANIDAMAARARRLGVALRPHAKTHKSAQIASRQRDAGAIGLTLATIAEAEMLCDAGFEDLLVAFPPVGEWRLTRLVELADRARVTVLLDSETTLAALAGACRAARTTAGWLWEVECGTGRCGTEPGEATATLLARLAEATPALEFRGLLAFAGHAYAAADRDELLAAAEDERRAVADTAELLEAAGCPVPMRSIGTTPTSLVREHADGMTELRPGNYVFNDATQVALGLVALERCALSVLGTVVSRPNPHRLILDCGSKALGADRLTARSAGFGLVVGEPDLVVERLYEEHAIVSSGEPSPLRIGDRVRVVPNHACAAVNLHERMLVTAQGAVIDEWRVAARGWPGRR